MPKKKANEPSKSSLRRELISQSLALLTSGFGVVAALAWNDAIQAFVKEFVEPAIPGSGLISKFVYALLITSLIVFITYQLSTMAAKIRSRN